MNASNKRLVYSTESGKLCPDCAKAINACICKTLKDKLTPETDGIVRLHKITSGKKGAGITLITGLGLAKNDLNALAKKLKKTCGSGGTVSGHDIEIQGDKRQVLQIQLEKLGYKVKLSGG